MNKIKLQLNQGYIWIKHPDFIHFTFGIEIYNIPIPIYGEIYNILINFVKDSNLQWFRQGYNEKDWIYIEFWDGRENQNKILEIVEKMLKQFPYLKWIDKNELEF